MLVPTAQALADGLGVTLGCFVTSRTRAVYYNTPQNPSGVVFNRAHAEAVAAFAVAHDLVVIADEAYEDLVYGDEPGGAGEHVSIASLPGMYERTITTYTLSKSYAMTGWRVGYAVAPEPWTTALRKLVLYTTNGVSTPVQWAAVEALRTPRSVLDARREEYRTRRDLLVGGLNELGLPCELPAGAFYAFPDVRRIAADSRQAAALLLEKAHFASIPGRSSARTAKGICDSATQFHCRPLRPGSLRSGSFSVRKKRPTPLRVRPRQGQLSASGTTHEPSPLTITIRKCCETYRHPAAPSFGLTQPTRRTFAQESRTAGALLRHRDDCPRADSS